jgi:hypothetical protein
MPILEASSRKQASVGKIFIAFLVVVAVLVVAREERVFEKWGITGSCTLVRSPSGDVGAWYRCSEGFLTGYPSLIGDQCTYELRAKGFEYWRCPVRVTRFASGD